MFLGASILWLFIGTAWGREPRVPAYWKNPLHCYPIFAHAETRSWNFKHIVNNRLRAGNFAEARQSLLSFLGGKTLAEVRTELDADCQGTALFFQHILSGKLPDMDAMAYRGSNASQFYRHVYGGRDLSFDEFKKTIKYFDLDQASLLRALATTPGIDRGVIVVAKERGELTGHAFNAFRADNGQIVLLDGTKEDFRPVLDGYDTFDILFPAELLTARRPQ